MRELIFASPASTPARSWRNFLDKVAEPNRFETHTRTPSVAAPAPVRRAPRQRQLDRTQRRNLLMPDPTANAAANQQRGLQRALRRAVIAAFIADRQKTCHNAQKGTRSVGQVPTPRRDKVHARRSKPPVIEEPSLAR
jgi:hypothetical protein